MFYALFICFLLDCLIVRAIILFISDNHIYMATYRWLMKLRVYVKKDIVGT